jgi:hypothetical protein
MESARGTPGPRNPSANSSNTSLRGTILSPLWVGTDWGCHVQLFRMFPSPGRNWFLPQVEPVSSPLSIAGCLVVAPDTGPQLVS